MYFILCILKILNMLVLLTYHVTKLLTQISSQETKSFSDSQGISHLPQDSSQQSTNCNWYFKQVFLQNYFKGTDVNMRYVSHGPKVKQRLKRTIKMSNNIPLHLFNQCLFTDFPINTTL
jgi:hypothetical protein